MANRKFEITVQAAHVANDEVSQHIYTACTKEEAVREFWADVDAFELVVSKVLAVREVD